jgi:exopolyphosphatase / guanosine-5'-triphosphate,3'-diphosphate pyrophosphatase
MAIASRLRITPTESGSHGSVTGLGLHRRLIGGKLIFREPASRFFDMAAPTQPTRIAAIDIGSNSIRQIVADVSGEGAIRVLDEMKAQPRLGAGLQDSGGLDPESMTRAVEALGRMSALARQLGAERIEAVATSAVRDAANAADFLARVKAETGLEIRVLDGPEEARLCFRSALAHFDLALGRTVLLDIGGGSLEIVLSAGGVVDRLVSLPLGAIRLTEQFMRDGISPSRVKELRREVRSRLREEIPARDWRRARVIGSGGTFTNLAGIHLARRGVSQARSVHGARVPHGEVEHILDLLVSLSADERRAVPGLNPERADIIVAGLAVVAEVLTRLQSRELIVSRYGIREGILLETARITPTVADAGDARQRSVLDLAERCHYEVPHARQVRRLALRLFDALGQRLGLTREDRAVLADAALLHDIGYHISYERHHKHSYHLILHAELLGMSPAEQVIVANLARYHRGAPPKKKHRNYGTLDGDMRRRIKRLAALLRVADGLDRGHSGAVRALRIRKVGSVLRLTPEAESEQQPVRLEAWGAHRKSALLADVLGMPIEIVAPDGSMLSSNTLEPAEALE